MATLKADRINPIDGENGRELSPTYPTYSLYAAPTHQIISIRSATEYKIPQTLSPLLPYITSNLTLSSQEEEEEEEEDTRFIVVKKEERVEHENDNGDEKPKISKKRKFYINQTSKQREADISYHRKKLDVKSKMEQYRYV